MWLAIVDGRILAAAKFQSNSVDRQKSESGFSVGQAASLVTHTRLPSLKLSKPNRSKRKEYLTSEKLKQSIKWISGLQ